MSLSALHTTPSISIYAQPRRGHRILTLADEDCIRTLIEARPSVCLDEIQENFYFYRVSTTNIGPSVESIPRQTTVCMHESSTTPWSLQGHSQIGNIVDDLSLI